MAEKKIKKNKNMAPACLVLLTAFALVVLPILPVATNAAVTIQNPTFTPNKATYSAGDVIIMTFNMVSSNNIVNFTVEITNTSLDLSASTSMNYTLTLVGTPTSGNWMYVLNSTPAVYQVTRAFATDNTSYVQTADYSQSFLGFRVQQSAATGTTATMTTSTTTASAAATTTTTTSITSTTSETQGNLLEGTPLGPGTPLGNIITIFTSNPIFIVILALIIIVPLIILAYVLTKRPKNELYNMKQQNIKWSQDGDSGSEKKEKSTKE